MTKTIGLSLTIQEIELPYSDNNSKGRLFAAVPESDKPLTVTADQWRHQILETAEATDFKHLVVPWSFWPDGCPPDVVSLDARHVQVMDTVAGIELLCNEMPEQGLTKVSELLSSGHDLLLVCASQSVPGFVPAALTQMSEPDIHIVKLWYPVVVDKGYKLTPFQIGYLTGFASLIQYRLTHCNRGEHST